MWLTRADEQLLLWINSLSGHFHPLDYLVRGLASDYLIPVSLSLLLLALWFSPHIKRHTNQMAVICAAIAIGFANWAVKIINWHYFRPRPFTELNLNLVFYRPHDSSFPSNAATVAFALAMAVFIFNPRASRLFFILAFLLALSRVYVGVHYPLDVLGGAALGLFCGVAAFGALKLAQPLINLVIRVMRRLCLA